MKSTALFIITIVSVFAFPSQSLGEYLIDADLSDWGVSPFDDWTPNQGVYWIQADNVNLYNAGSYVPYHLGDDYDCEALYFDDDEDNLLFAIIVSMGCPLGPRDPAINPEETFGGDLGFDLNGDVAISEHGQVTGLEYAVRLGSGTIGTVDTYGDVLADTQWKNSGLHLWPDGWQGSPWQASTGTELGKATVSTRYDAEMEKGTWISEIAVPRELLPEEACRLGTTITAHISMWCGNDSLNLNGTVEVPEPTALLLFGPGFLFVRKRKSPHPAQTGKRPTVFKPGNQSD